jgi:Sec-independent protein translocase protein TatA
MIPLFPLSVVVVATGVAFALIGPRRIPQAVRSTWRFLVDFKRVMDDANSEVDDILKSAWREFRDSPGSQRSPLVDTVVVIIGFSAVLICFSVPAIREFCLDVILRSLI